MTHNIMVDLETLGSTPGCSILSIGAIAFDPSIGVGDRTFEIVINRQSCRDAGLHEDADTLAWWDKQSPAARAVLAQAELLSTAPLGEALSLFDAFVADHGARTVRIWGNGSDFDNAILAAAYRAAGLTPCWSFWNNRCYRTLKNLRPEIKLDRHGLHHRAIDDAISQAHHAVRLLAD